MINSSTLRIPTTLMVALLALPAVATEKVSL
jgi:hypothetical protein